jgi:hypothetical protein
VNVLGHSRLRFVSDTAQSRVRAARRFLRLVAGWHEVAWYLGWTRNLLSKALLRIQKRSKSALKLKQQLKLCVCVGARANTHTWSILPLTTGRVSQGRVYLSMDCFCSSEHRSKSRECAKRRPFASIGGQIYTECSGAGGEDLAG